jgi:nitroimidazol reductase NimA-like FMN-containing flavoprotein (pyridoxamine 5'-phosphate oxidase superfamily)
MQIHELSARECHEVLNHATIARLATAQENQPYVVPIHVYFDGADLYSFATLGRKIDWMRANPKVCVEVEDVIDRFHWRTVVVLGRYDELVDGPAYEKFRRRAHALFQNRPEWWQPAATHIDQPDFRMPVIYRIAIDHITGRLALDDGQGRADRATPRWLDLMFETERDSDG